LKPAKAILRGEGKREKNRKDEPNRVHRYIDRNYTVKTLLQPLYNTKIV
jgi:hypothetical protein